MTLTEKILSIAVGALIIVILCLRSCTPTPEKGETVYIPGKPYALPPETTVVEKPVYIVPKIPIPSKSDTLKKDTLCPPIVENTYEVIAADSVLEGTTFVTVEGKLKEIILDYKVKESLVKQTIARVDTLRTTKEVIKKVYRNQFLVGLDLGLNKLALAPAGTFVFKQGSAVTLRYDFFSKTATVGGQIRIGK